MVKHYISLSRSKKIQRFKLLIAIGNYILFGGNNYISYFIRCFFRTNKILFTSNNDYLMRDLMRLIIVYYIL